MIQKIPCARSEKDITRVSGTLGPSSILGGRTTLIYKVNLANLESSKIEGVAHKVAQNPSILNTSHYCYTRLSPDFAGKKRFALLANSRF